MASSERRRISGTRISSMTAIPWIQPSLPEDGYHLTVDLTDKALEFIKDAKDDRAREAVLPVLRARRLPRPASRSEGVDRQVQGPVSTCRLRGAARADHWLARRRWGSYRPIRSCRRSTRSARPRRARGPTGSRSRRLMSPCPWDSLSADEQATVRAHGRGLRRLHGDTPIDQIGRLLDYLEETGERENTIVIVISDNGASGEGGPERLGERDEVR